MTVDMAVESAPVRCAAWTSANGVDPIGSAITCSEVLIVEWPLPWPSDIGAVEELWEVGEELARRGGRLQAVVPTANEPLVRVARYRRTDDLDASMAPYVGTDLTVAPADVVDAALDLLEDSSAAHLTHGTDVLLCAHGRRDRCCGSAGTALALRLDLAGDGADARVGRTSHLGGHRYAPTAFVLPQATMWAYADADLLGRVSRREGPLDDVLPRYRGYAGHDRPEAQLVDRVAFDDVGWDWPTYRRSATVISTSPDIATVELTAWSPAGEEARWAGTVVATAPIPVPRCGEPITVATKFEPRYELIEARRTA